LLGAKRSCGAEQMEFANGNGKGTGRA